MHARRAGLAGVLGFAVILAGVGRGEAKEFEIDGTADCGVLSERRCSIDSTLAIWTDDVSGTNQRVEVDVSWIRQALGAIDQDDHVCFVVEDRSDGRLQATGIGQGCDFEGTINPGLSTDEKDVREQPRRKDDDDDHSNAGPNDQQVVAPAPGVPLPVAPPVVAPPVRTVTVFVAANDEAAALVDIVSGQHVTIVATGTGTYGNEGQAGCVGVPRTDPNGNRSIGGVPCTPPTKFAPSLPLPSAPVGALIGRLGTAGSNFLIGSNFASSSLSGRLFLRYNDDNPADNTGGYTLTITITG